MRFPQTGLTCSPVRKICRSANSMSSPFDANSDVDGTYCNYRQPNIYTTLPIAFQVFGRGTSTTTPRYRLAYFKLAHQILQSRPHSNPLPSRTNAVPCRSCQPVSILARISANEAPNSMTVKDC